MSIGLWPRNNKWWLVGVSDSSLTARVSWFGPTVSSQLAPFGIHQMLMMLNCWFSLYNALLRHHQSLHVQVCDQSKVECRSATSNFSRVALCHLYFSRGEFRFEKLRNAELHERGGEEQGRNYVTHNDKKRSKKGHQNISLLRVTGCQIAWAPLPLESIVLWPLRVTQDETESGDDEDEIDR